MLQSEIIKIIEFRKISILRDRANLLCIRAGFYEAEKDVEYMSMDELEGFLNFVSGISNYSHGTE